MVRPSADCCSIDRGSPFGRRVFDIRCGHGLTAIGTRHKSCCDDIAFGTSELFIAIENTNACELLSPLVKGPRIKADTAKSSFGFRNQRLRDLPRTQVVGNISFNDSFYANSFERWMCGFTYHIIHMGKIGDAEMIVEHQATESLADFSRHSPAFDEAGFGNKSMKTKILVRTDEL